MIYEEEEEVEDNDFGGLAAKQQKIVNSNKSDGLAIARGNKTPKPKPRHLDKQGCQAMSKLFGKSIDHYT